MSNIFAGMDLPEYGGPGDLSQADLQKIMGLRGGSSVDNKINSNVFYDPRYTTDDPRGWMVEQNYGYDYAQGDGGENVRNTAKDQTYIRKVRPDTGGNLGDYWTPDGKYQGTYTALNGGGGEFNRAVALMAGGYLGGTYLSGLNGAQTGVTGLANGTDLSLFYGGEGVGAGAGGLTTGAGTGGLSAAELAAYSPELTQTAYTGATGLTPASTAPGWMSTAKDLYTGAGQFLNSGWGKALTTAAGLAMTKNAKQGPADPMLQQGSKGLTDIGNAATGKANSNDAYFNSTFLPQYLSMMGRANARDQELYDFNMGRARLAANQMDKYYSMVDAYDNENAREQAAGKAMATARQANSDQAGMMQRRMAAMGVNPASGAWGAAMGQLGNRSALNEALAANMARDAAKREGLNMRASAAGLRGADSAYAGNALQGANLGMNAVGSAQSGFNANSAGWNATMGLGANSFGQLGGWGLSRSNSADQLSAANTAGWNGLIGYGLGALWNSGTKGG